MVINKIENPAILKIFRNFTGHWKLSKILGNFAAAEGYATFTKINNNEFTYHENLTVKLINQNHIKNRLVVNPVLSWHNFLPHDETFNLEMTKIYYYSYYFGEIIKYFDSAKSQIFYHLNFSNNYAQARGQHICSNDYYYADYYFINDSNFILTYYIAGLHKNYKIINNFEKIIA